MKKLQYLTQTRSFSLSQTHFFFSSKSCRNSFIELNPKSRRKRRFEVRVLMAMNEGFDGDPGGGLGLGFSHLLESSNGQELGFDLGGGGGGGDESFMYSSSFPSLKPSTMLCFSNVCSSANKQKSTSDHSSSVSSSNNSSCTNSNLINNNKLKKRSHDGGGEVMKTEDDERRNGSGQNLDTVLLTSSSKKPKKEKPGGSSNTRSAVRKEKLGERITALQQLVSPFGKTDTASVLHEAMGYIRFLHDQVQVLSSPYLQNMTTSSSVQEGGRGDDDEKMMMKMKRSSCGSGIDDLRSRGLCLVPVDYTVHVADCNGADLWSPAVAMGRSTSTRPSNNSSISTATTSTAFNQY